MSPSRRDLRFTVGRAVTVAMCAPALAMHVRSAAPPGVLNSEVAPFVAEAARTSPADFAYALAEARVPAGFIAADKSHLESGTAKLWHLRTLDIDDRLSLGSVVKVYEAHHEDFSILIDDGVLLVEDKGLAGPDELGDRVVDRLSLENVPLMTAFYEAMRIVDPTITVKRGVVGSVVSTPEEKPSGVGTGPFVSVHLAKATFRQALNEIVTSAPGAVWLLTRHDAAGPTRYYSLAFRVPEGRVTRFPEKLRPAGSAERR